MKLQVIHISIQNIGQTSNKGIEIALNYDVIRTKDFTLGVSATYNYNHNNIDELADNIIAQYGSQWASSATTPTYDYEFREGKPVGLIRGYICDGYYTTADFNYDPATKTYTLKPGVADLGNQVGNYPSHYNLPEVKKHSLVLLNCVTWMVMESQIQKTLLIWVKSLILIPVVSI